MIKGIVVECEGRSESGKNACRRMRAGGKVPAVVYGLDKPPHPVAVSPRRIEDVLKLESGRNTVFTLSLGGEKTQQRAVMIREIQRDPVSERMLHIDFVRVDLERKIEVRVPIRLIGTPTGVKNEGGVLDFIHREVEVECLPTDIPEHFDVDVSELHLNQHVGVENLTVPAGVALKESPETIIAVVSVPRVEAEPVAEEEVAAEPVAEGEGEPEVIKKGKEAEEGKETGPKAD